MRKTIVLSTMGFVAVLAILLALVLGGQQQDGRNDSSAASAGAHLSHISRPECPIGTLDGITLECLGAEVQNQDNGGEGKPIIATLWAWWCEPCRAELPLFAELAEKHPEVEIIGVHVDKDAARGAALLDSLDSPLPSLADPDNALPGKLGLPGVVPITVVFDADGEMESFHAQPFTTYEDLEQAVL